MANKQKKNKLVSEPNVVAPLLKAHKEEEEQLSLKEQYNIEQKDVIVIEKKSETAQILKAIFKAIGSVVRVIGNIVLVVLAIIGLATLLYPSIREEAIKVGLAVFNEIRGYINV